MKNLFLTLAFLSFAGMACGQSRSLRWLEGSWQGEGYQPYALTHQHWHMDLRYGGSQAEVDYPGFPCGGTWEYVRGNRKEAEFIERIGYGSDKCANNLKVVVKRQGKKHIEVRFLNENGGTDASALLAKAG